MNRYLQIIIAIALAAFVPVATITALTVLDAMFPAFYVAKDGNHVKTTSFSTFFGTLSVFFISAGMFIFFVAQCVGHYIDGESFIFPKKATDHQPKPGAWSE